jgi:hypothetical protein
MTTYDFLNTVYDVLAQNEIDPRYQMSHDEVIELVDHVDSDRKTICFKTATGKEFELQLVNTYAPPRHEPEPKCSKYTNDVVLPDEDGNCSLCGSTINKYGECIAS